MILVIVDSVRDKRTGQRRMLVSHGVNLDTDRIVVLPQEHPEAIGAKFEPISANTSFCNSNQPTVSLRRWVFYWALSDQSSLKPTVPHGEERDFQGESEMANIKTIKTYEFPNARICRMKDGTYREFPKWCPMISVERSRNYVAEALKQLRIFHRGAMPA